MVEAAVLDICNFLKTKNILIPTQNQWLRGCITCFKENTHTFTQNQLKEFVFDQWKLADLKDIRAPSLPNNCTTASKLILPGKYAVQINYVINIGESFYKQLQKIRRPTAEENLSVDTDKEKSSNEPSASRTLKLEITDGMVTLLGFEDKQIRKLVEPFVPGVKAILKGPIECRKGVLFLKNENIDLLGGEVDTLHIPNAQENILARGLSQPENPDPFKLLIKNNDVCQEENILEEDSDAFLLIPDEIETSLGQTSVTNHSSVSLTDTTINNSNQNNRYNSSSFRNHNMTNDNIDKSKKIKPEQKPFSCTTKKNVTSKSTSFQSPLTNSDIVFDDKDDDVFAMMGDETNIPDRKEIKPPTNSKQSSIQTYFSSNISSSSNRSKSPNREQSSSGTINKSKTDKCSSNEHSSGVHINEKIPYEELRTQLEESYSDFMVSKNSTVKADNKKPPDRQRNNEKEKDLFKEFHMIEKDSIPKKDKNTDIITFPPKKYPCTQIVEGRVIDISQKLSIQENKWSLSSTVKIKGLEMEVDFSSSVLDSVFGMTAEEMQAKRLEVKKTPGLKDKINEILKSSQRRIQNFDGIMKLHFSNYIAKPIVLELMN